jgi:hypothetical protein
MHNFGFQGRTTLNVAACSSILPISFVTSHSPPTYHLLYIRLPKTLNQFTFPLVMANAMFAKTMDNLQY